MIVEVTNHENYLIILQAQSNVIFGQTQIITHFMNLVRPETCDVGDLPEKLMANAEELRLLRELQNSLVAKVEAVPEKSSLILPTSY